MQTETSPWADSSYRCNLTLTGMPDLFETLEVTYVEEGRRGPSETQATSFGLQPGGNVVRVKLEGLPRIVNIYPIVYANDFAEAEVRSATDILATGGTALPVFGVLDSRPAE